MQPPLLLRALLLLLPAATTAGCAATGTVDAREESLVRVPVPASAPAPRTKPRRTRCAQDDLPLVAPEGALEVETAPASAPVVDDDDQGVLDHLLFGPDVQPVEPWPLHPMPKGESHEPWWDTEPDPTEVARAEGRFRAASGWYVGPTAGYVQISNKDLDGTTQLVGPGDTISLAEPDPGSGFGAVVGYRFEAMAFEFNFLRTQHDAQFGATAFDATFQSFSLNLKNYFLLDSHLQPYLDLGLATTQFVIEDGASAGAVTADATLEDEFSINFGAGFAWYLTPRLALSAHAEYRLFNNYNEATGVAPKGGTPEINANGLTVVGSLTYTF